MVTQQVLPLSVGWDVLPVLKGWVASHQQVTSSVQEADMIHHNGCGVAGLRNHPVLARCVRVRIARGNQ